MRKTKLYKSHASFDPSILKRIQLGLIQSPHTPNDIKDFCRLKFIHLEESEEEKPDEDFQKPGGRESRTSRFLKRSFVLNSFPFIHFLQSGALDQNFFYRLKFVVLVINP